MSITGQYRPASVIIAGKEIIVTIRIKPVLGKIDFDGGLSQG